MLATTKLSQVKSLRRAGFTLIETLAVLAVVGVMITALAPCVELALKKTHATQLRTKLLAVNAASKVYYLEKGKYADSVDELIQAGYISPQNYHDIAYNAASGKASSKPQLPIVSTVGTS